MATSGIQSTVVSGTQRAAPAESKQAVEKSEPFAAKALRSADTRRSEGLAAFKTALSSQTYSDLKAWTGSQLGSGHADRLASALMSGAQAFQALKGEKAEQTGDVNKAGALLVKLNSETQQLDQGRQVLELFKAAHVQFQAAEALQQKGPSERWQASQWMRGAGEALKTAGRADMGVLTGGQAELKAVASELRTVCTARANALEREIRQGASPEVKMLFQGRDAIDQQIKLAQGRLSAAKSNDNAQAQGAARGSLEVLLKERKAFDQMIGDGLKAASGPAAPVAANARKTWADKLLPSKLVRHFRQNEATQAAARGDAFQPKAGLDNRYALASHLKGVFQRAGLSGADLPSRTTLRQALTVEPPSTPKPAPQFESMPVPKPAPKPVTVSAPLSSPAPSTKLTGQVRSDAEVDAEIRGLEQQVEDEFAAGKLPASEPPSSARASLSKSFNTSSSSSALDRELDAALKQADQVNLQLQRDQAQLMARMESQAKILEDRNAQVSSMLNAALGLDGDDADLEAELELLAESSGQPKSSSKANELEDDFTFQVNLALAGQVEDLLREAEKKLGGL